MNFLFLFFFFAFCFLIYAFYFRMMPELTEFIILFSSYRHAASVHTQTSSCDSSDMMLLAIPYGQLDPTLNEPYQDNQGESAEGSDRSLQTRRQDCARSMCQKCTDQTKTRKPGAVRFKLSIRLQISRMKQSRGTLLPCPKRRVEDVPRRRTRAYSDEALLALIRDCIQMRHPRVRRVKLPTVRYVQSLILKHGCLK